MEELLRILGTELMFFLDGHGYQVVGSGGSARGNAYLDLRRGDLVWRLLKEKGCVTIELRFHGDRDYPVYSTDILIRWMTEKDDDNAGLLTADTARWLEVNLARIEKALAHDRPRTVAAWEELKRKRAKELFG